MLKSQINFMTETFGDQNLPVEERWKCIKYISLDGQVSPIRDFQLEFARGMATYIDDDDLGPAFYIFDTPNTEFHPTNDGGAEITIIPIESISSITVVPHINLDEMEDETEEEEDPETPSDGGDDGDPEPDPEEPGDETEENGGND